MVLRHYAVNTFESHTENNYNKAIRYYAQKKTTFLMAIQAQLLQSGQQLQSIESLETIFQNQFQRIQTTFLNDWQTIYNKSFNQAEFQSAIKGWNQITRNITQEVSSAKQVYMLSSLLREANGGTKGPSFFNENLTSLKGISEDKLFRLYQGTTRTGQTAKNWKGLRAAHFGEIFENSMGSLMKNGLQQTLGPILQYESTGGKHTINPSGKTQGKTDVAISTSAIPTSFNLDAAELIDFNNNAASQLAMGQFMQSGRGIAGINIKQWTEENILKDSLGIGLASFGNFQKSASLVNARDPGKKISYIFKDRQTFDAYTGYQVSRFLINILGAYNLIMASGSNIMFMDEWLNHLRLKNYLIVHTVKKSKTLASIRKNDTVDGYYEAKKNLILVQH